MKKIFFFFLILFSGVSVAETIPATASGHYWFTARNNSCGTNINPTCSWQDAINADCQAVASTNGWTFVSATGAEPSSSYSPYTCNLMVGSYPSAAYPTSVGMGGVRYTCPSGQGWTLSGAQCTRSECPDGASRKPDGTCGVTCNYPAGNQTPNEAGDACICNTGMLNFNSPGERPWFEGSGDMPSSMCDGGCMRAMGFGLGGGGAWTAQGGAFTGEKCSGNTPSPSTPKPDKKPPCSASEGVMTSSSGTVACVPEGTPNARQPKMSESKTSKTNPDGSSSETTKTTTTDPATGASSTTSSTTTTSSSGSQTTSSTVTESTVSISGSGGGGDNSGDEPGQCAKEPDSPMCKQGTVKEKGNFGEGQADKLNEAKQQLTDAFNTIKSQAQSTFAASAAGGGGSLPCPPPVTVLGRSVSVCVSDYSSQLSVIGSIIVFAAGILAILLVVTA